MAPLEGRWAKAAGLRTFDFDPILPEHARAALRRETVDDSDWGVTPFKFEFGGGVVMGAYDRSLKGFVNATLSMGESKFLARSPVQEWAGRS